MQRRCAIQIAFFMTVLFGSQVGFAETTAADKALADSLFNEGRALLKEGKFVEACPKFEASQRADPSVGTALNLGDCYEQTGRTASAYGAFGEAERLARARGEMDRRQVAQERQARLGGLLSRLVVRPPASSPVEGLVVKLDDKVLDKGVLGSAIPLDPGKHLLEASSSSAGSYREEVEIPKGPSVTEKQIALSSTQEVQPDKPVEQPRAVASPSAFDVQLGGDRVTLGKVGIALIAGGFVGLAAGAAWGGAALDRQAASEGHCDVVAENACDAMGYSARKQAGGYADASTWSFVSGGVLAAAGVTLLVTGVVLQQQPSLSAKVLPVVSPGFAGMVWRAEF